MKIKPSYLLLVVTAGVSFFMGSLIAGGKGSLAQDQLPRLEDQLQRPGDSMEEQLQLPAPKSGLGVVGNIAFVVHQVETGSPADQLGLQRGDLITEWNGRQIISIKDFMAMGQLEPGQAVEIEFVRANFTTGKHETMKGKALLVPSKLESAQKQR
jgi:serine protease Do